VTRLVFAALLLIGGGAAAQDVPPADSSVRTSVPDVAAQRFAAMDLNGDGRLDGDEWDRAVAAQLAARPVGGTMNPAPDAPLPLPTAKRAEMMHGLFTRLDTNGDGALTMDEVRAFGRALAGGPQR